MPPHPNFPCHRCSRQFGSDETMFMVAVGRNRNPLHPTATAPVCEPCTTPEERGCSWPVPVRLSRLSAFDGPSGVKFPSLDALGCLSGASSAEPPLPSRECAKCKRRFIPKRRGTGKVAVKFCSMRCRTRARDDRKLAQARATRDQQRRCASCVIAHERHHFRFPSGGGD
jgi:hypothetical protein